MPAPSERGHLFSRDYTEQSCTRSRFYREDAMAPLDHLFTFDLEFRRRLRCDALGTADPSALHPSYALQAEYEGLLRRVGRATVEHLERARGHLALAGDPRDLLAAIPFDVPLVSGWSRQE